MNFNWDNLKQKMGNINSNNNDQKDERFWSLTRDESGTGTAVVRLVPGKGGETTPPIVRVFNHEIFLKKPTGRWGVYKNPSPSTIERPCPVSDAYMELKNCGIEQYAEKIAGKIGRRTQFISNVYIVNDLGNPSNNGKLMLWGYGKTIFEQILGGLEPSDQQIQLGVSPKNLFDLTNGEEIVVSVTGKKLETKYALSFNPPKALCDATCVNDIIMNKAVDLNEFINEKRFKDYEILRKEFAKAISDTDIEKALLEIGSKVITTPYSQNSGAVGAQAIPVVQTTPAQVVQTTPAQVVQTTPETTAETTPAPSDFESLLKDL
jgi:aspartate 1-decarboxylase